MTCINVIICFCFPDSLSGDFSLSPRDMPSFDSLDKSSPRRRNSPRKAKDDITDTHGERGEKSMQFVPSHFQVAPPSVSDESMSKGLDFPDVNDESSDSFNDTFDPMATSFRAALATQMMSQTLSTIVTNTLSGLTGIRSPTSSGGVAEQQRSEADILEEFEFLDDEDFEDNAARLSDVNNAGK